MNRTNLFISYAHRGDVGFTPRLAFDLELLDIEVFWDQKLQLGSWESQLQEKIRECDYFLVVMSQPYAVSKYCQDELGIAQASQKIICPIKVHTNYIDNAATNAGSIQFCDFSGDFDAGFRKLTQLIINHPVSSWEWLGFEDDDAILIETWTQFMQPSEVV